MQQLREKTGEVPARQPELLPAAPMALPWRKIAGGSLAAVCAAGIVLWTVSNAKIGETTAHAPQQTVTRLAESVAPGAVVPVPKTVIAAGSHVYAALQLAEPEKKRIVDAVAAGKLRVGAIFLWDNAAEDGDAVRLTGAGYDQDITLSHGKKMFYVPYEPGTAVRLTGIHDGGGGITVGVATITGPVLLPALFVGQAVDIPVL